MMVRNVCKGVHLQILAFVRLVVREETKPDISQTNVAACVNHAVISIKDIRFQYSPSLVVFTSFAKLFESECDV